ncbi:MAG: DUF3102 domain-containing protein [Planctomycetota bacterium]
MKGKDMTDDIEKSRISEIKAVYAELVGYLKTSLPLAIRLGKLLTEQKGSMQHGEFTPWIEANLEFSDRTARYYMGFYRNRHLLKTEMVSDMKEARKLLSAPATDLSKKLEQRFKEAKKLKDGARFREFASLKKAVMQTKDPVKYGNLYHQCLDELNNLLRPAEGMRLAGFAPVKQEHSAILHQGRCVFYVMPFEPTKEWAERVLERVGKSSGLTIEGLLKSDSEIYSVVVCYGDILTKGITNLWYGRLFEKLYDLVDLDNLEGTMNEKYTPDKLRYWDFFPSEDTE